MIETIAITFRNETFFKIYVAAMMAVMVGPMVLLTIYYHRNVGKTDGGRKLMREHARHNAGGSRSARALRNLGPAGRMARDIAAGNYGGSTRDLQNRTYRIVGLWVLANVVMWAILLVSTSMYPDPLNPPGLRQPLQSR